MWLPALGGQPHESPREELTVGANRASQRRRAAACRAGCVQPLSAGLIVTPGGLIASIRSRTSSDSTTSAAVSCDSKCSIVRGPMIGAVTAGWRRTKAIANSISVIPVCSAS